MKLLYSERDTKLYEYSTVHRLVEAVLVVALGCVVFGLHAQ